MKKFYFIIALLLMSISTRGYSQVTNLGYTMCGDTFEIAYEQGRYGFRVVSIDDSYDMQFMLEAEEFPEFRKKLSQIRDIYAKWSKVARTNNLTNFNRTIDIPLTVSTVGFYTLTLTEMHFAFNCDLGIQFFVKDGISYLQILVIGVTDYFDKSYTTAGGGMVFNSLKEIDDFIAKLDSIRTVDTLFN